MAGCARKASTALRVDAFDVVADRGFHDAFSRNSVDVLAGAVREDVGDLGHRQAPSSARRSLASPCSTETEGVKPRSVRSLVVSTGPEFFPLPLNTARPAFGASRRTTACMSSRLK